MTAKKSIWVTTSFAGYHQWPGAPDIVAFLRALHRHKFGVRVEVAVNHSDRDVEFFIFGNAVNKALGTFVMPAMAANRSMSCEMIAQCLYNALVNEYPSIIAITIDEDGENGATLTW